MTFLGWLTIVLFIVILTALALPLGRYMAAVYTDERTFLDPLFRTPERLLYRAWSAAADGHRPEVGHAVHRELLRLRVVVQRPVREVDVFERDPHAAHVAVRVAVKVKRVGVHALLGAHAEVERLERNGLAAVEHAEHDRHLHHRKGEHPHKHRIWHKKPNGKSNGNPA